MSTIYRCLCIFFVFQAIMQCEEREKMRIKEVLTVYLLGSVGYRFIEILWRGRTHWTMGLLGGICILWIYCFEQKMPELSLVKKAFISAAVITLAELVCGLVVNKWLLLNVWDYSEMKYNFLGQISLLYSLFWFLLCIMAHPLCRIIRHRVFDVLPHRRQKNFERQPGTR